MGRIFACLFLLLLPGCALLPVGADDDSSESGWSTIRLTNAGGSTTEWSVADRGGKALVSLTAGRALGLSVAGSMVLSPSAFLPEQSEYQRALLQYLVQTDRPNCRVISGTRTTQFQYEFVYDCAGTAVIEPRPAR